MPTVPIATPKRKALRLALHQETPLPIHWSEKEFTPSRPYGHHADLEFQNCPRKYYYHYERGLEGGASTPLIIGGALHAALAVYHGMARPYGTYARGLMGEYSQRAVSAFTEAFSYLDAKADTLTQEERDEAENITYRTLKGYVETYAAPDPWQVLVLEQEFDLDLFAGIRSTGRFDGLISYQGASGPQTLVLEHKTTSYTCDRFYEEFSNDQQITRYCRAASLLIDQPVHGVLLNVLHKAGKNGVAVPKFARYVLVRTERQIEALAEELYMLRFWREEAQDKGNYPRNTSTCFDFFRRCPYYQLCFGAGETEENLATFIQHGKE